MRDIDIKHAADLIQVEPAVIKAVLEVETGNKGGFINNTDNQSYYLKDIYFGSN